MPKPYVRHPVDLYSSYPPIPNAPHPNDPNPYSTNSPNIYSSFYDAHHPHNPNPYSPRLRPHNAPTPQSTGLPRVLSTKPYFPPKGGKYSKNVYKKVGKKEVLGKDRVIYKMKGSNKEYLKTKGMYIPVSEYKKLKK